MRKITLACSVALAAAALAPTRASAATGWFDNYCTTGSMNVCASVRVSKTAANKVVIQVWNLYGLMGAQHTIDAIGLYHSGTAFDWNGTITGFKATYKTGSGDVDITSEWGYGTGSSGSPFGLPGGGVAKADFELRSGTTTGNHGGIFGCGTPTAANTYPTSCAVPGLPYAEFEFTLSNGTAGDFLVNDALEARWHSIALANGQSLKCDTGGNADFPCEVVPEPVTMLLLGTGLAGMGGFGLIRRRKRNGDVEST